MLESIKFDTYPNVELHLTDGRAFAMSMNDHNRRKLDSADLVSLPTITELDVAEEKVVLHMDGWDIYGSITPITPDAPEPTDYGYNNEYITEKVRKALKSVKLLRALLRTLPSWIKIKSPENPVREEIDNAIKQLQIARDHMNARDRAAVIEKHLG